MNPDLRPPFYISAISNFIVLQIVVSYLSISHINFDKHLFAAIVNETALYIKWFKNYLKFLNVYFLTRQCQISVVASSTLHAINTDSVLISSDHNPNSHFIFFIIRTTEQISRNNPLNEVRGIEGGQSEKYEVIKKHCSS